MTRLCCPSSSARNSRTRSDAMTTPDALPDGWSLAVEMRIAAPSLRVNCGAEGSGADFQLCRQLVEGGGGGAEAVQGHGDGLLLEPIAQLHPAGCGDRLIQQGDLRQRCGCGEQLRRRRADHADPGAAVLNELTAVQLLGEGVVVVLACTFGQLADELRRLGGLL